MSYSEYNNSAVNGQSCAYTTLGKYYNKGTMASVPPTITSGTYVVPVYSAPGYNTLTGNGQGSCSGYYNIQSAYGNGAEGCNQKYVTKACASSLS